MVVLAESKFNPSDILDALNGGKPGDYCYPVSNSLRIQLLTRFSATAVSDQFNDGCNQAGCAGGWL